MYLRFTPAIRIEALNDAGAHAVGLTDHSASGDRELAAMGSTSELRKNEG